MSFFSRKKKSRLSLSPLSNNTDMMNQAPTNDSHHTGRLISYRAACLQGIGAREKQEDAYTLININDVTLIRERGLLAVVADGMGGMKSGDYASCETIRCLQAAFETIDYQKDIPLQLCDAVKFASDKVFSYLDGEGGSTVVVCLFYQGNLYYVSCGDSFLYLFRKGQLSRINRRHTVYGNLCASLISRGEIDPSSAREDEQKEMLLKYVGVEELDDFDFFRMPLKLEDGDILLLCSDGVAGVLNDSEIIEGLSLSTPENMCVGLEQLILEKNKPYQDNYTALVIKCEY